MPVGAAGDSAAAGVTALSHGTVRDAMTRPPARLLLSTRTGCGVERGSWSVQWWTHRGERGTRALSLARCWRTVAQYCLELSAGRVGEEKNKDLVQKTFLLNL